MHDPLISPPHATLFDLLRERQERASSRGMTFLGEGAPVRVAHASLLREAAAVAAALRTSGVEEGEPVPMVVPTSPAFLRSFFGLLLAGAVPCPQAPAAAFADAGEVLERVGRVVRHVGARHVVTTKAHAPLVEGAPWRSVWADVPVDEGETWDPKPPRADDVALIQGTSGSSGPPKGVMLTHGNLCANTHQIGIGLRARDGDVVTCWLPLHHDMGLIGCLLFCLASDLEAVFLPPQQFLRRPASWLRALSDCGGTLSPAPNFAYGYINGRVRPEDLDGVRLDRWRSALCGAEPIDLRTLETFQERLAVHGLPPGAATPCYGLAEATLAVTMHSPGTPLISDRIAREPLASGGALHPAPSDDATACDVVSCGPPLPGTRVRITGPDGAVLPDGRVGLVEVSGPTVMKGYFGLPHETAEVVRGGWLDTGDLGYLSDGGLRLTGRSRDLVIIRGSNHAPSDFEWAAAEVEGVRPGGVAAFGLYDEQAGTEALHIVCETDATDESARDALRQSIRARVAARTGVVADAIALVPRHTVPKTTSGKVRRALARQIYVERLHRP